MDRRQAIKNIGMGAGFLVATPALVSILQSCTSEPEFNPVFLTKGEGHALRRMVDLIIPSDNTVPGAADVGVHTFIDQYWNDVMKEKEQVHVRKAFQLLADDFRSEYEKELEAGKPKEFDAVLSKHIRKTMEEEIEISDRMGRFYAAYEGDPTVEPDANDAIYSLLSGIRGMTIWGWKTSETIAKNHLWYDPVPGTYKGCIPIDEAGDGKAMAL